ncbi:MAG: TonB-dependent receptor [Bacteroidetes bacterium]|nr:TonB-dependent receptor [Bacteroidota bacterium]
MKHSRLIFLLTIIVLHGFWQVAKAQDTLNISTKTDSIVDWTNTKASLQLNQEQIQRLPFRQMSSFGMLAPSAYQQKGVTTYYYGIGSSGYNYFIDGMQLSDVSDFPTRTIETYQLHTRQAPIQMGFNIGGITVIETMNSQEFSALVDVNTDQAYDMSSVTGQLYINIPFAGKKKNADKAHPTLLISGKYATTNNTDPVWKKTQKLNDETLAFLQENPLRPSGYGVGTFLNAEFVSSDNFIEQKAPDNSGKTGIYPYVKLTLPMFKSAELTLGNYSIIDETQLYNRGNSLFNTSKNAIRTRRNFNNFLKWKQQFKISDDLSLNYNLHFQYTKNKEETSDPNHGTNFFDYAYVGQFTTYKMPTFEIGSDTVNGIYYQNVWLLNSWDYDTLVTFQPSNINPELAAYTTNYYSFYEGQPQGHFQNMDEIMLGGGLINGYQPNNVYSGLYNSKGSATSGYQLIENERIRVALQINADYKKHHFTLGGEYNRESRSYYSIDPNSLWQLMTGLTNYHIRELDMNNPEVVIWDGYADTILYQRNFDAASQTDFDKNLRQALGLPVDGIDFIDINSYNRQNNTIQYYDKNGVMHTLKTPDNLLSLNLFSADELLNGGNSWVSYGGYDYLGNKTKTNNPYSFFEDFTTEATKSKYWAAYIQDEFNFRNIRVKVGLKVNVYDASRPVLNDPYSLFAINDVEKALALEEISLNVPSNIGNNYMVYVDKVNSPTRVVGYRNGDKWYNAGGIEIFDPTIFDVGNGISPYLENPEIHSLSDKNWTPGMTFKDNTQSVNFLPQLSIDYTLIDRINFYANYSSFTQNPQYNNEFRPEQYYFWSQYAGSQLITNPNLKPMQANKFFTGVKARIWKYLIGDISYINNSIDNYVQLTSYEAAYPSSYITVSNANNTIVIQGIETSLNWANPNNSGVSGGISVTRLYPNDKEDRYYQIRISELVLNATLGYRFADRINYNGPAWANNGVFHGLSANIYYQFRKGLPYYKTRSGGYLYNGIGQTPNINLFNLNIQKDFAIGKKSVLNFFLAIENLFNFQNVFEVYSDTGLDDDDGFLANPASQSYINAQTNPDSYRLLYQLHLYDPSYYDIPRIWRIGIALKY